MTNQPRLVITVGITLVLAACEENQFQPPPPPPVTVASPAVRDVTAYVEFTGTTESFEIVEARARVQGYLQEVAYAEGQRVEAGAVLFRIDPAPFVAARDSAKARVTQAKAEAGLAKVAAERLEIAYEDRAVSEIQFLEAKARAEAAEAAVEVAEKELAIRELDVSYCTVQSPISGLPTASKFEVGALVGTINSSSLALVEDSSRIYAWFSIPDRMLLELLSSKDVDARREAFPEVELATETDDGFPWRGRVDYADPSVNAETGTLRVRAVFDNPDRGLVGGLFVRVRMARKTLEDAVLLPESAIGSDQAGRYVYVVGADGVVERRKVVLGPSEAGEVVITDGIAATDTVIVEGLLRARPGSKVTPRPAGS